MLKTKTLPNKENLILKSLGNNVIEMIHVIKGKNMVEQTEPSKKSKGESH